MEVEFQPMQSAGISAGIKEGCTLVYRVVGQDYANRKGNLISLAGNIAYMRNKQRGNIVLSFKIGMIDSVDPRAKQNPRSLHISDPLTERPQGARLSNIIRTCQGFVFLSTNSMGTY